MQTTRLQIRAKNYRGDAGFILSGNDAIGRSVSIFFEHRSAAERTRDRMKSDPDFKFSMEDFEAA